MDHVISSLAGLPTETSEDTSIYDSDGLPKSLPDKRLAATTVT
jgi:hypothetical protein